MLCSDRTSTLTHNIMTIEPKLPWCDAAVDVRSDWSDQVDGVIHILYQLFGVGALAHRGLPPFIGGLCGDHSPHRTTMTQTKCCPILHFGLWWLHLPVVSHGTEDSVPLVPEPSRTRGHTSALVLLSFRYPPSLWLGVLADSWQRSESYLFLCRYGRRSGQPSSSSLARRACVHVLPFSSPTISVHGFSFSWSSPTGTP